MRQQQGRNDALVLDMALALVTRHYMRDEHGVRCLSSHRCAPAGHVAAGVTYASGCPVSKALTWPHVDEKRQAERQFHDIAGLVGAL